MNTKFNHDSALALLREYNKEPFHILHGQRKMCIRDRFYNVNGIS